MDQVYLFASAQAPTSQCRCEISLDLTYYFDICGCLDVLLAIYFTGICPSIVLIGILDGHCMLQTDDGDLNLAIFFLQDFIVLFPDHIFLFA